MPSLFGQIFFFFFFCGGREAREYHGKPEEHKRVVIQQLIQILGSSAADLCRLHRQRLG